MGVIKLPIGMEKMTEILSSFNVCSGAQVQVEVRPNFLRADYDRKGIGFSSDAEGGDLKNG